MNSKFSSLVESVVYIALKAKPNAVRGTEVCKALGLQERYLEADFQNLVRAGVLKSVRGPKGGYTLARERRNISMADIYAVCGEHLAASSKFAKAVLEPIMQKTQDEMMQRLKEISVDELATRAASLEVFGKPTSEGEFVI